MPALIVEPEQTRWLDAETGKQMGTRGAEPYQPGGPTTRDGGPTSWQALIVPTIKGRDEQAGREFVLEFQDFQLAYNSGSVAQARPYQRYTEPTPPDSLRWGWFDPSHAIASPQPVPPPTSYTGPTLISTPPEPGSRSLNYRSEPIPFRVAHAGPVPDPAPDALCHGSCLPFDQAGGSGPEQSADRTINPRLTISLPGAVPRRRRP